jgi:hypothetical protein
MNRTLKILLITIATPIILVMLLILYFWVEMQVKRLFYEKPTAPVIGDLGGVPVAIPRPFARFVEYDADPGFMEKRKSWSAPERTFQSKLRGFGFEVRYPDMASAELKVQADKDIYTTMWMRVGITTGEDYGVDHSLDNHKNTRINSSHTFYSKYLNYVPLQNKTYGLTGYTPVGPGINLERRNIEYGLGADMSDKNIYFFEEESGHVTTFIECSNMSHEAAPCQQRFNLNPVMKAHITVSYRKGLLSHWQQIQKSVTELIYSFEVNPSTYTSTKQRN